MAAPTAPTSAHGFGYQFHPQGEIHLWLWQVQGAGITGGSSKVGKAQMQSSSTPALEAPSKPSPLFALLFARGCACSCSAEDSCSH